MQSVNSDVIVVLGTGGTIAGTSGRELDNVGYRAAQIGVEQLLHALPGLAGQALEAEQVAQVDSKDMGLEVWARLAHRLEHHLARAEVAAVVVTHGTDTLEETAWFLHRVLAPAKPVVMTAAMRPATALLSDGPQNMLDAMTVARTPDARGVMAVVGGTVFAPGDLRKVHTYRLDAFAFGDAGPLAVVEEGQVRRFREWPATEPLGVGRLPDDTTLWPRVALLVSHAGVDPIVVDALLARGVQGIVVAGTGNGTIAEALGQALHRASSAGVVVWRASRCAFGRVIGDGDFPSAGPLSAVQARIELMLQLMLS
ncbi:MAG TPA: asparaginase [Burkholderiaceae bacterium]|nr:asparaginase [Burkholderiaceae bacterium]